MQELITRLKSADENRIRMLRRGRLFLAIATACFLFAFAMAFLDPRGGIAAQERQMMMGGLVLIYLFVTTIYAWGVRKLSRIDYSESVRRFLEQAEVRYRFMRTSDWLLSVTGVLLVTVIMSFGSVPYLSRVFGFGENYLPMSIIFPSFVIAVAAMGLYFTRKNWERDRAPLWLRIKQMQEELGNS